MRVYVPATIKSLARLVSEGSLFPVSGTAFALTPALREAYVSGSTEELEYTALLEAARGSLRLINSESAELPRRVVIAVDVPQATLRPDLDPAVVRLADPIQFGDIAAVHVDTVDAEDDVRAAVQIIDVADLGDPDAEFVLGGAEDHELAWYAPQELPFLLELL